jgi:hypothetical protein
MAEAKAKRFQQSPDATAKAPTSERKCAITAPLPLPSEESGAGIGGSTAARPLGNCPSTRFRAGSRRSEIDNPRGKGRAGFKFDSSVSAVKPDDFHPVM